MKEWSDVLRDLDPSSDGPVQLSDLSTKLSRFSSSQVEVPGQYTAVTEPLPSQHTRIVGFCSALECRLGHSTMPQYRVFILGDDGRDYPFLVQHLSMYQSRGDERTQQMATLFNSLLRREADTRRRRLQLIVPTAVPISGRARLLQDHPKVTSMATVLEDECREAHNTSHLWLLHRHRQEVMKASGDAKAAEEPRMAAYKAMTAVIPETTFSRRVGMWFRSPDDLSAFRTRFTNQL
ncbi:unnamed protein product, partial [Symbiodinium sp. KB8]